MMLKKSLFKECQINKLGVDQTILVGSLEKLNFQESLAPEEISVEGFTYFFTTVDESGFWYETRGKRKLLLTR